MRLISASIKNYRVHEAVEVKFHPQTSLLGGQNESGKSTLVEAIHRALFLPAKGETSVHKSMRREGARDRPEVQVCFEHEGREYELLKHFAGNTGYTVQLREKGQAALEGDEAEEKLRQLIGAEIESGKSKTEESVRKPWSHLWVWQGSAGETPTEFIAGATDKLVELTSKGAGTVMMSQLDSRIANKFQDLHTGTYGSKAGSKVLVRSDLGLAESLRVDCKDKVQDLQTQWNKLEEAAKKFRDAEEVLAKAEPEQESYEAQIAVLSKEIKVAETVKELYSRAVESHKQANINATRLRGQAEKLKQWNAQIAELEAKFASDEKIAKLESALTDAEERRASAKTHLAEVKGAKAPLEKQEKKLRARLHLHVAEKALQVAQKDVDRIARIEAELEKVEKELKGLPAVQQSTIDSLRKQEQTIVNLHAQLQAVQSTVELMEAPVQVLLNGQDLLINTLTPLKAENSLSTDAGVKLKLVVPGVENAEAVQTELQEKRGSLEAEIASYIIYESVANSVQQLYDVMLKREQVLQKQAEEKKRLKDERADKVSTAFEKANREVISARDLDQKLAPFDVWTDPQDLDETKALVEVAEKALFDQIELVKTAEERLHHAQEALDKASSEKETFVKTRRADEEALRSALVLRTDLLKEFDSREEAFIVALHGLEQEEDKASRDVEVRRKELEETQLELLEIRSRRLKDSLANLQNQISAARREMNFAEGQLKSDGEIDIFTGLGDARDAFAQAQLDCERLTLDAQANAMLHAMFQEEIDTANERITEPLAEKVQEYLKQLFGSQTEVKLDYSDGKFGEFWLSRPDMSDYAEAFSSLSGGAREQVAAAVRLATAQLLAQNYNGQLPVVFDDAFVNTDPERIPRVIDMLYYAAEKGLQIIVSTCDPARYQGIGKVKYTVHRGSGAKRS